MNYTYDAKVVRVVDGDTVHLLVSKRYEFLIDFGFHVKQTVMHTLSAEQTFRLARINTPEMKGATLEAGKRAKAELERLLALGPITVVSKGLDKYGRWISDLTVIDSNHDAVNVNQTLLDGGFAIPYKE